MWSSARMMRMTLDKISVTMYLSVPQRDAAVSAKVVIERHKSGGRWIREEVSYWMDQV